MPEIGEVARIVHYLRKHVVNRTVASCQGFEDDIVYGKVGCSASAFQKAVQGKKVTGAGQQGKYFYVTFDSPPHSVMHLGMTGWIKFSAEETGYYRQAKENVKAEEWPPKYMKWLIKCDAETVAGEARDAIEIAFVDARRLARVRLVDCEADQIRQASPLKENGPDPVIDKAILTVEWLEKLLRRKKVPVKAMLLDQGNISGVGNWVADEVLYQARIHPEQYSNTFNDDQVKRLHDSLINVCTIACATLADSTQFPADWLMKYRWDKGKKASNTLPNGEKITHLTVGGRTSAIVPSVQKKTGPVAGDVDSAELEDDDDDEEEEEKKPAKGRKRKAETNGPDDEPNEPQRKAGKKSRSKKAQEESTVNGHVDEAENKTLKRGPAKNGTTTKTTEKVATPGSRKSSRIKSV